MGMIRSNRGLWLDFDRAVGAPLRAVQTHGRWKSPSMPARYTRGERAFEALEWLQ